MAVIPILILQVVNLCNFTILVPQLVMIPGQKVRGVT